MKNRILDYLAAGVKPAQAASIVGCSPGYVSQLCKEESFRKELEERIKSKPADAAETDIDTKYQSLEHSLLRAMEDALPGAELPAITRALETVARVRTMKFAQRNPIQMTNPLGPTNLTVISVSLPAHALPPPAIEVNSQGEILAINHKPLAPLSSDNVKNLFEQMRLVKQAERIAIPVDY